MTQHHTSFVFLFALRICCYVVQEERRNAMDSLYQRLKEMDPDTFQRFCFQLLKERHPGQELRHVEGASGDEGLDVFAGVLP
jgi:hypothetical protein